MAQRSTPFKQVDVTRACKGVMAAGLSVARAEIEPVSGKIVVHTTGEIAEAAFEIDRMIARK